MPSPSRRIRAAVLGSLVLSAAGLGALVAAGAGAAPTQDLPDLTAMLPEDRSDTPNARWIDTVAISGRTLFRFDSVIFNNGPGAIEVTRTGGTTYQRTYSGGLPGATATDRALTLGGPGQQNALRYSAALGHDHFHSQRMAAYELRTTAGAAVASAAKNLAGFCMFDSWGTDSSPTQFYVPDGTSCRQGEPNYAGDLSMGLSPGWGDLYGSQLWDQWVDVTDVTPGTYRLYATADPQNIYQESNEGNNASDPVDVVIPGVVANAKSVSTPAGQAVNVTLTATVVGANVKSRKTGCDPVLASCMTTATGAITWSNTAPTTGTATRTGATVRYTPPAGFTGTATFTYRGTDSRGLSSKAATVTITVAPDGGGSGGGAGGGSGAGGAGGGTGGGGGVTNTITRIKPKAVGLSVASLKPTKTSLGVHASGVVAPPAGAASQVCAGKVLVQVVAGRKVVRSGKAALRRRASACRYLAILRIPKSKVGQARSMKITARFLGSTQLLPRNATTRTIRIG